MKITIKKIFIEKTTEEKNRLNPKISIFLFCLVVASIFWILNALAKDLTLDIQYPCIYEYSSEDLIITNSPPSQLKVFAQGSGFNLLGQALILKRNPLQISLSDLTVDQNGNAIVYTKDLLDEISNQLGSNISVESIYPTELKVKLEEKVTKSVPVVVNSDFSFVPQIRLKNVLLPIPQKVTVSGAKSVLDSIYEIHTILLDQLIKEDVTLSSVDLVIPNTSGLIKLKPKQISLEVKVEQFTESSIALPIKVINLPKGLNFRILPSTTVIKFLLPVQLFDVISADNFSASVDYKDIYKDQSRLKIRIQQEKELVEIIAVQPERAEYLIKK